MITTIALLRAVNVGGTGKLPMKELVRLCEECGFTAVRTYIASGNVVFKSSVNPARSKTRLEKMLNDRLGKPVAVLTRSAEELARVLEDNPFPDAAPDRTVSLFLDEAPPADFRDNLSGTDDEVVVPGTREIYVHYPSGMGRSKLKIPAARNGTARNMNTIRKLVSMTIEPG
jgi:uncharacterized protein (DUF1697 family)